MFYLLWGGCCIGGIALFWEVCNAKTAKLFAWSTGGSDGSNGSPQMRLKQLTAAYEIKTVVDGIYEHGGDVWVCFTPKP